MNFPSSPPPSNALKLARQRAYHASLTAQVTSSNHRTLTESRNDGRFVRNIPGTPDGDEERMILGKPLPPMREGKGNTDYYTGYPPIAGSSGGNYHNGSTLSTITNTAQNSNASSNSNSNSNNILTNQLLNQLTSTQSHLKNELTHTRNDNAKHNAMLLNQHSKDTDMLVTLRDRVRVMENEMEGFRGWRHEVARSVNENGKSLEIRNKMSQNQSQSQMQIQARQMSHERQSKAMNDSIAEINMRIDKVRNEQMKSDEDVNYKINYVVNKVNHFDDDRSNSNSKSNNNDHSSNYDYNEMLKDVNMNLKKISKRIDLADVGKIKLQNDIDDVRRDNQSYARNEVDVLRGEILVNSTNNNYKSLSSSSSSNEIVHHQHQQHVNVETQSNNSNVNIKLEERMKRLENNYEYDKAMKTAKEEKQDKELKQFMSSIQTMAKTAELALKNRYDTQIQQTFEKIHELSQDVGNVNEMVRSSEKRITALTAASIHSLTSAMESGLKVFNQDVKEIREVLSAEISARRNGLDQVANRIEEVGNNFDARVGEVVDFFNERGDDLKKQIVDVHGVIDKVRKEALKECEKIESEADLKIEDLVRKLQSLSVHVDNNKNESVAFDNKLQLSISEINSEIEVINTTLINTNDLLKDEVTSRENEIKKTITFATRQVKDEASERSKQDEILKQSMLHLNSELIDKIESEDLKIYNQSKVDTQTLDNKCFESRTIISANILNVVKSMDERVVESTKEQIEVSLNQAKSYTDKTTNEKSEKLQIFIDKNQTRLTNTLEALQTSLNVETEVRSSEYTKLDSSLLNESRKNMSNLDNIKMTIKTEAAYAQSHRLEIITNTDTKLTKTEESCDQKLSSEAASLRSLIKSSIAAEASQRMYDVNDVKTVAEDRLQVAKDTIKIVQGRDKEFVLSRAAAWVDAENAARLASEHAITNGIDVRNAEEAAKAESRETLNKITNRIADAEHNKRVGEMEYSLVKMRNFTNEIEKDKDLLRSESTKQNVEVIALINVESADRNNAIVNLKLTDRDDKIEAEFEAKLAELESKINEADRALDVKVDTTVDFVGVEIVRIDAFANSLQTRVDGNVEEIKNSVEYTKSAIMYEAEVRLREDCDIRFEELCREGAENCLNMCLDVIDGEDVERKREVAKKSADDENESFKKMENVRIELTDIFNALTAAATASDETVKKLSEDALAAGAKVTEIEKAVKGAEGRMIGVEEVMKKNIEEINTAVEGVKGEGLTTSAALDDVKKELAVVKTGIGESESTAIELLKYELESVKNGEAEHWALEMEKIEALKTSLESTSKESTEKTIAEIQVLKTALEDREKAAVGIEASRLAEIEALKKEVETVKTKLETKADAPPPETDWEALRAKGGIEKSAEVIEGGTLT